MCLRTVCHILTPTLSLIAIKTILHFRHIKFYKHIVLTEVVYFFFQNLLPHIIVGSCNILRGDGVAPHVLVSAMFLLVTVGNNKGRR